MFLTAWQSWGQLGNKLAPDQHFCSLKCKINDPKAKSHHSCIPHCLCREVGAALVLMFVLVLWSLLAYTSLNLAKTHPTDSNKPKLPTVVNTWPFTDATEAAWNALNSNCTQTPALDAIVQVASRDPLLSACKPPLQGIFATQKTLKGQRQSLQS